MNSPDTPQPGLSGSHHADVASWEATVMKNVASLLDSLEVARKEWDTLSQRLAEAREKLSAAEGRVRDAEAVASELSALRKDATTLKASRDEARTECDRLRAALDEARAELGTLRDARADREAELEKTQEAAARVQSLEEEIEQKAELLAVAQRDASSMVRQRDDAATKLEQISATLERVRRERDLLAESGKDIASARDRLADGEKARADAEMLAKKREDELARLRNECEQSMVLICDLRGRINRLEQEAHDASSAGKRKTKKILRKIHEALDAVGAPAGEEMSYGERLRRLVDKLTGAAPLDIEDPFDEFDAEQVGL